MQQLLTSHLPAWSCCSIVRASLLIYFFLIKEDFMTQFDTELRVADIVGSFSRQAVTSLYIMDFTSGGSLLHGFHLWWLASSWVSPLVACIFMGFTSGGLLLHSFLPLAAHASWIQVTSGDSFLHTHYSEPAFAGHLRLLMPISFSLHVYSSHLSNDSLSLRLSWFLPLFDISHPFIDHANSFSLPSDLGCKHSSGNPGVYLWYWEISLHLSSFSCPQTLACCPGFVQWLLY